MRSSIKGSYTQLRDSKGKLVDKWRIQIYTGHDQTTGKYRRYTETFKGNEAVAKRRLKELSDTQDKGTPIPQGKLTVADHLRQWLEGYVKIKCSPMTIDSYQSTIENHLIPSLGHIQIKQLSREIILNYYSKACETLSARSVHYHHRLLKQSLKYALRQGVVGRNVCELVDPPTPKKKTMRTLTLGELETLLDKASGDRFYPTIYCAVSTGLRQAELLGLSWRDIDLDYLSISVNKTLFKRRGVCQFQEPKTEHSRRRVCMTPKLALYLKEYRKERENIYLERGQILSLDSLVFASPDGKPFDPGVLSHTFNKIVRQAGLTNLRFHDLRHTFASLMLLRGAKPKVISEALGHSSVSFTMDTYSHIIEGMQEDAMALLDTVLPVGINGVKK